MANHKINEVECEKLTFKGRVFLKTKSGRYARRVGRGRNFHYFLMVKCSNCGAPTLKHIANHAKNPNARSICSARCKKELMSGPNNPAWMPIVNKPRDNGKLSQMGYAPNHPKAHHNRVPQHRLVMEKELGRFLESVEEVHHIDCDQLNNAPDNLDVMKNTSEHHLAHGSLNSCVKELIHLEVLGYSRKLKRYFVKRN